ncbi:MAG: phospholipid/cholesterol/gamma-HCH transport system substrate-binding protein [Solirubrobacteraceae bacterium]|nr:phospholipid/cholesterol/gamma-HCH transport system substrate-binding protein [Solirubrobacteraceae bacterium]
MLVVAALAAVIAGLAVALLDRSGDYTVHARFRNAGQLVKGNLVQVAGVRVGSIDRIALTPDGHADVAMRIDEDAYRPLRRGTRAIIRQASLSGVANRYVDLHMPPGDRTATIPDGGAIGRDETTTAVDLDELFNTFDPRTRKALSGLIRGHANVYAGQGERAGAGWAYLNPSLAASDRLFREVNLDTPLLQRFIDASSRLVTDVAERRADLTALVDHLETTTGALGREGQALGEGIGGLPDFMRRANTTFVNLRATLDDAAPLVEEAKPVARKLRPFLAELRPLARDARPTLRDLSQVVRSPGPDDDLIDLTRSAEPLRDIAVGPVTRNGARREGAFPASAKALGEAAPELATMRPYAPDLTGWFDDFSHSGLYDALGGSSRAAPYVNLFANVDGVLKPLLDPLTRSAAMKIGTTTDQRWRCPGAVERGATWKPAPDFPCDETEGPLGK